MELESAAPKIRVVIRKRPLTRKELQAAERDTVEVAEDAVTVREQRVKVDLTKYVEEHVFRFDDAFDERATNAEVYAKSVRPIVEAAFAGSKVSCFAYGQTGSGKTYTMLGEARTPGLYALAAADIFDTLALPRHAHLSVLVSYFEIYCGKLFDLLNHRKKLQAREDGRQNVNIVSLRRFPVESRDKLCEMIALGSGSRVTSATGKNTDSSRSHAILQICLVEGARLQGLLSFIDLAGNERGGDTYEHDERTRIDGAEISKSLLALKECIRALDLNLKHVPFRGSKLTMVLKDSFVGNSKTVMIGNVSPAAGNTEYTLNTLRYADRVKELKKEPRERARNELMLPRQAGKAEPRRAPASAEPPELQGFIEEEIVLEEEELGESHQRLVNEILDEEESLLQLHKLHIKQTARSVERESVLLTEVDRPGSDIEAYVAGLAQLLSEKSEFIERLRAALEALREKLGEERRISQRITRVEAREEPLQ